MRIKITLSDKELPNSPRQVFFADIVDTTWDALSENERLDTIDRYVAKRLRTEFETITDSETCEYIRRAAVTMSEPKREQALALAYKLEDGNLTPRDLYAGLEGLHNE